MRGAVLEELALGVTPWRALLRADWALRTAIAVAEDAPPPELPAELAVSLERDVVH